MTGVNKGWMVNQMCERFWGKSYSMRGINDIQSVHGRKGAHAHAEWTTPEHWAHNNYERSHLPQLCIRASGWKARILACLLWPKKPWNFDDRQ